MNRDEYLAWAKERAMAEIDAGNVEGALASITSDMSKFPGTQNSVATVSTLVTMLAMGGHLSTPTAMRKFIEDIN